jgi:hypothetical protein
MVSRRFSASLLAKDSIQSRVSQIETSLIASDRGEKIMSYSTAVGAGFSGTGSVASRRWTMAAISASVYASS